MAGNAVKSRMAPGEIIQQPAFDGVPNPPGSLASGDSTIDWDGDGVAERYDGYQITLAGGDQLLLTASSAAFDPVLLLQRPGQGLATAFLDDHSGGGTTARLLVTADIAGTWTVVVTSRDENASGAYALQIVKDQHALVPSALVDYDFAYDKAGNLIMATEDQAAVAQFGPLGTAASRIASMTTPEGTSTFALDATDQPVSASLTGEAYATDNTGNRTSGGTQTSTGNRLLFDGTYRYAANRRFCDSSIADGALENDTASG